MTEESAESIQEAKCEREVWSRFEIGWVIPEFRLPALDGSTISPAEFKGKKNLAILYLDIERTEDWDVLWEVARRNREFAEANAQVLAIVSATREEAQICLGDLKLPFPVLYEGQPPPCPRTFADHPHLFVADRFGEIKLIAGVQPRKADQVIDHAITALELVELECPECGAPTWI